MITHLNYTFSVPDNRLYMLYKGITVSPRVVQASSMSSHGQTPFTRCAPCICFVRRPFHVCCGHVSWHHLDGAKGHHSRRAFWPLHTFGAEGHPFTPSAPKAIAIRDRRGGLFLRNNAHKTLAASVLSLNHPSTLHQNNPKSPAD
jgi:hypothetical protein